jgi:hypothetical protein
MPCFTVKQAAMHRYFRFFTPPYFLFFSLLVLGGQVSLHGQVRTERILMVNGGVFGDPFDDVTVMSMIPGQPGTLTVIDSIHSQSAQDLIFEGSQAWVAAQDSIVRYDLQSENRMASTSFGVQTPFGAGSVIKLGIYQEYLLAGNWYGLSDFNLRIFDKHSLQLLDSVGGLFHGASDFVVVGDSAYVVQNLTSTAFEDSAGFLSVVDLTSFSVVRNIEFPNSGDALGRLVLLDSVLYGINSGNNSISTYDLRNGTSQTQSVSVNFSLNIYGSQWALSGDTLITRINGIPARFDLPGLTLINPQAADTQATALTYDTVNRQYYLTQTDFFSYSTAWIAGADGSLLSEFSPGNSPEVIVPVYNHLPMAKADSFWVASGNSSDLAVLQNDHDPEGDSLSVLILGQPTKGSATVLANGEIRYLSNPGSSGIDSLRYRINDLWGAPDSAMVIIQLSGSQALDEFSPSTFPGKLFPNPVRSELHLQLSDPKVSILPARLISLDGATLTTWQKPGGGELIFQLPETAPGLYLFEIILPKGAFHKIIQIQ